MKSKDVTSAVADEREVPTIRVVKDQKKVRELLGDTRMNALVTEGFNMFKPTKGQGIFVFLVFNEEGKGKVWVSNGDTIDCQNDEEDVLTMKRRLALVAGADGEASIWLRAKKMMGWTD